MRPTLFCVFQISGVIGVVWPQYCYCYFFIRWIWYISSCWNLILELCQPEMATMIAFNMALPCLTFMGGSQLMNTEIQKDTGGPFRKNKQTTKHTTFTSLSFLPLSLYSFPSPILSSCFYWLLCDKNILLITWEMGDTGELLRGLRFSFNILTNTSPSVVLSDLHLLQCANSEPVGLWVYGHASGFMRLYFGFELNAHFCIITCSQWQFSN